MTSRHGCVPWVVGALVGSADGLRVRGTSTAADSSLVLYMMMIMMIYTYKPILCRSSSPSNNGPGRYHPSTQHPAPSKRDPANGTCCCRRPWILKTAWPGSALSKG